MTAAESTTSTTARAGASAPSATQPFDFVDDIPLKRILDSRLNGTEAEYHLHCADHSPECVPGDLLLQDPGVIAEFHIENDGAVGREWANFALYGTRWGHLLAFAAKPNHENRIGIGESMGSSTDEKVDFDESRIFINENLLIQFDLLSCILCN